MTVWDGVRRRGTVCAGCGRWIWGMHVAARLKQLGVSTLVVERNARIGDNW